MLKIDLHAITTGAVEQLIEKDHKANLMGSCIKSQVTTLIGQLHKLPARLSKLT